MTQQQKKRVIVGISSSIAAYKAIDLCNSLNKKGYDVHSCMTPNTLQYIQPTLLEIMTHNKCITDTFQPSAKYEVEHITLAHSADVFILAPATANVIAKLAHGIADDFVTTTFLACTGRKIVAPAMNTTMLNNPITQENIKKLESLGVRIVKSESGRLACGDVGDGKLASVEKLVEVVDEELFPCNDFKGKRIVVTAGPTQESIDPVRFITNRSTGKMGYSIAQKAAEMGGEVILVSGPTNLQVPRGVKRIDVKSAIEMHKAVLEQENIDVYIMTAAVADYRPKECINHKMKKKEDEDEVVLSLVKNPDILKDVGMRKKEGQIVIGFAMETEDLIKNATVKLQSKNADMIVANQLNVPGAGFAGDTNKVVFITKDGLEETDVLLKLDIASMILKKVKAFGK